MSDVLENDFFANVQVSALMSPHLIDEPPQTNTEFETSIPIGPGNPSDTLEYPEPKPDIENLEILIQQHERELFGRSNKGVIEAVIPTRESRLLGLAAILGNFEEYKFVKDLTKTQLNARAHKLDEVKEVAGKKVRLRELINEASAEIFSVYVERVNANDTLIQVLHAVRNHQPSGLSTMSDDAYEHFTDDALFVFARTDVNKAVRNTLAKLKKKAPETKVL
jgi:hypothetical protein